MRSTDLVRLLTLTFTVCSLGACERASRDGTESTDGQARQEETPESPRRAEHQRAEAPEEPTPREPSPTKEPPRQVDPREAARAMAEALETTATKELDNPCTRAHATLVNLSQLTSTTAPPRERFLEVCADLPAPMQRCLSPAHQMSHRQECAAARDALEPAQMEQLREVMSRGGRDVEPATKGPPRRGGKGLRPPGPGESR